MKIVSNKIHPEEYLKFKDKIAIFDRTEVLIIGYTYSKYGGISLIMKPLDENRIGYLYLKDIKNEPNTYIEKEYIDQDINYFRWTSDLIKLKE